MRLLSLAVSAIAAFTPFNLSCDPPNVVTVYETDTSPVDVSPPQRLDIIMNGLPGDTASVITRCDDYGGTIRVESPHLVCQGVDY